jgi:hypothetical protein
LTARISEQSSVEEVAAIVSDALESAGMTATLSGGSAVTIYSNNAYLSRDLDFVTSAMVDDLRPVLEALRTWFANEGESEEEFRRFREAVRAGKSRQADT